jgi:enterochelin esterase-like enzyme
MITFTSLVFATLVNFQGVKPFLSTEVHGDQSITFKILSPNAKKVSVGIEGQGNLDLVRGEDGIWEATSKSLHPDIYGYTFNVDGVATFDPQNPITKANMIYVANMVTVPGDPPENWEVQAVPHGEVTEHFYKSAIVGDERNYFVYTPPGYRSGKGNLPVLYLLHGFSDMANGWNVVGKAHVIMDNLIAQKKVKPMMIVMTLGYGVPDFVTRGGNFRDRDRTTKNFTLFRQALLEEVIPTIERDYRASKKQSDRAIAGLSMGGAETLFTGLNNADKFAYIGAFSSGGFPSDKPEAFFPNISAESTKGIKVLWMSCGTADGLIGFQHGFTAWLDSKGVKAKTNETGGGHEWPNWRRNLAEFAQMIFK